MINRALLDYYRCPEPFAEFTLTSELSRDSGFFQFGPGTICYGQSALGYRTRLASGGLYDVQGSASPKSGTLRLPFDPTQVIDNLRLERYMRNSFRTGSGILHEAYYAVRPLLPVPVRGFLQRLRLSGWDQLPFPHWPVDRTVESILEKLVVLSLRAHGAEKMPFIWFWPDGAPGCLIMTHDVETSAGHDFCGALMDIDDSFGVKASFQFVPEKRYTPSGALLGQIRARGFEVNVHDLNHDGHLFGDRRDFLHRAAKINGYAKEFGAAGFRSGVMYRNLEWYDAFEFAYDMSVPNVAHLDPQHGGCCTVMPYFIGRILELPLTTTQDYALFNVLRDHSTRLWKEQIRLIMESHGLVSFIIHPDYIMDPKGQRTHEELLGFLAQLRDEGNLWAALPGEVDRWWRERSQMKLVCDGGSWRIEGMGCERARIAYAALRDDKIVYSASPPAESHRFTRLSLSTDGELRGPFQTKTPVRTQSANSADSATLQSEPGRELHIAEIDFHTDPRWNQFLASCSNALIFHHPSWLEALEREYAQHCVGLACEDKNGNLMGILPLMETRGLPTNLAGHQTGRRLTSLPRTPVAGPLCVSPHATSLLLREAMRRADEMGHRQLELKAFDSNLDGLAPGMERTPWRISYVYPLPEKPESVRFGNARNHARIKWAISKARKHGVEIRVADDEKDLRDWHLIYLYTMRSHGVPPRSYRFFKALWELTRGPGLMRLWLAERMEGRKTRLLAGSIVLGVGQTSYYAFNGCHPSDFALRPNDLLQWCAIHEACVRGFRWYDLGEVSDDNPTLAKFKSKWGAQPKPLYRYYYPAPRHRGIVSSTQAGLSRSLVTAWRHMPLKTTALLGDWIYSYL
ncbi:MAG TPA: GNAT family N-acetyltransferase [Candidatus Acidoferrales bacterium]|nr:GNAT family N-acetyltransferase [Candidatus Acidoferrales bacterium]